MATNYYREPLTQEELKEHSHDYKSGNPAVYVGTYGKYNEGSLKGEWIDLTTFCDYPDFLEFCERLHADEADPELMFQDYEGFPSAYYGESHLDFDEIIEYSELSEDEQQAFDAYADNIGSSATIEGFREAYIGEFDSGADFAEYYYTETGCFNTDDLPDWLRNNIDWDGVWRDLKEDVFENNGYYFWSI